MIVLLYIAIVLIAVLGIFNIIRMSLYLIGGSIYDIKKHSKKRSKSTPQIDYHPKVSVVIPAHNEEEVVIRALRSVVNNTYKNIEIIVVDDGSTDKTLQKLKSYQKRLKRRKFKILHQKNSGKATALNNAIKKYVTGEITMCLDADSALERHAIANGVKHFADRRVKAMASNVKIIKDGSLYNAIQRYEYLICYAMKKSQTTYNYEYIIGGIGSMFRTSTLRQVKFYNTQTMTEDINLTMKIIKRGNKSNRVIYGNDVIAYTESVANISQLIRQRFRWKYGRFQTFIMYKDLFFNSKSQYSKSLTWFYMPYALFAEFIFLFEPLFILISIWIIYTTGNFIPLFFSIFSISLYYSISVLSEDNETAFEKFKLVMFTPIMYFLFLLLSLVELIALLKCIVGYRSLISTTKNTYHASIWKHVSRSGVKV